jgi:hypothetical protein
MRKTIYSCPVCGKKTEVDPAVPAPECCGERMIPEPLPLCSIPVSAESSRTASEDGPCADGTTPKKD